MRKAVDCIEVPKKKDNGKSGFEKINKRVNRKREGEGSEGKQREGEVSLTSGFLSAVSASRSREGRGYFGLADYSERGKRRRKMQLGNLILSSW